MNVRAKFLGGAQTVTGSKYLLEIDNFTLLVDCGLFQGLKKLRERNWDTFPVDPSTIDAVVITHAHIDHTGYLPKLVQRGFQGPVYCTDATAGLMEVLLLDSAKLQEEEAEWARKKGYSKHDPPLPLYTTENARKALKMLHPYPFDEEVRLHEKITVTFHNAGHILGAAIVKMILTGAQQRKSIVFSGDLGRYNHPILRDPAAIPQADILFIESTYGNRDTISKFPEDALQQVVNEAFEYNGCLIIPAFALGRTQTVIYYLRLLMEEKKIPEAPIYIDSPMAINVTGLYKDFFSYHKLREEDLEGESIFDYKHLHYTRSREASMEINSIEKHAIIISASGMCTGGRIMHHLYHRLPHENDTILFVGYQAKGTRGRDILEEFENVRMFGTEVPVRCHVRQIDGLSAHADKEELLQWTGQFTEAPKRTFVVHGEPESATALANTLYEEHQWQNVFVPDYLESFELFQNI